MTELVSEKPDIYVVAMYQEPAENSSIKGSAKPGKVRELKFVNLI